MSLHMQHLTLNEQAQLDLCWLIIFDCLASFKTQYSSKPWGHRGVPKGFTKKFLLTSSLIQPSYTIRTTIFEKVF